MLRTKYCGGFMCENAKNIPGFSCVVGIGAREEKLWAASCVSVLRWSAFVFLEISAHARQNICVRGGAHLSRTLWKCMRCCWVYTNFHLYISFLCTRPTNNDCGAHTQNTHNTRSRRARIFWENRRARYIYDESGWLSRCVENYVYIQMFSLCIFILCAYILLREVYRRFVCIQKRFSFAARENSKQASFM